MLLGLTGGYCAGKNAVADILAGMGWTCIDVDALGHEAVESARDGIVRRFGPGVLTPDGRVDRRAVARIVFADAAALADQEAIVHPIAARLLEERIAAAGREARICVNAALLHRTDRLASCEAIIEVRAPLALRLLRGMGRDGAGPVATMRRITRQKGFSAALRAAAGLAGLRVHVLRNWGGRGSLSMAVQRLLAGLHR